MQRVHVIPEIEGARKTGPRKRLLIPATILALRLQQVLDSPCDCHVLFLSCGQQAQQGPRSLRSSAGADAAIARILVRSARLSPAAIVVLVLL